MIYRRDMAIAILRIISD